jgi:hypothetical protein
MTIPPTTDPRQAALDARDLVEYAEMHPSCFSDVQRYWLWRASVSLQKLADEARAVC